MRKPLLIRAQRLLVSIISILVILSCSLPGVSSGPAVQASPKTGSVEQTGIAMNIQSTVLAGQKATIEAVQSAQPTVTLTSLPTYTPYPTYTSAPSETPRPEPTQAAPTQSIPTEAPVLPAATQDVSAQIRKANVLVFEDIQGYPDLDTRVHQAVTMMGFSGGRVVEVGDAVGNFMEQLNSAARWDLIVVAAEARSGVRGEFWDVIMEQVNRGVGLVVEIWYLDDIANGRISPLLSKCGVKFQKDWGRPVNYNQLDYSLYWLDQFHEVFSEPNVVGPLYTPNTYWEKDAGDLIMLGSGGDAVLLAGRYANRKSDNGVLAVCLEGRMIIQTYSTHDYRRDHTVPLWQNFMTYTLKNHFLNQK